MKRQHLSFFILFLFFSGVTHSTNNGLTKKIYPTIENIREIVLGASFKSENKTISTFKTKTGSSAPYAKMQIVNGRSPADPTEFFYETSFPWMLYVTKGSGELIVHQQSNPLPLASGKSYLIPAKTKFAVIGKNLEYLSIATSTANFYMEQAFIVSQDNEVLR